jgi:signal peptidase I
MYRAILALALIAFLPALSPAGERAYIVRGTSMSTAIEPGDTVVVSDEVSAIKRGDMVALEFKSRENPIVKRVVAVAGDRVEVKDDVLYVNGKELRRIDAQRWAPTVRQLEHYGWVVPENNIFVLGDNPRASRDSRRLGLISTAQVVGKVVRIIRAEN